MKTTSFTLLTKAQAKAYAWQQIPERLFYVEAGILACKLILDNEADDDGDLSIGNKYAFEHNGVRLFVDWALDSSLLYSRLFLNFLGIYKQINKDILVSRPPASFSLTDRSLD